MTDANLRSAGLSGANLAGATVIGTDFSYTTERGFTKEQLYTTASYQAKNLRGVRLDSNDLTGWDFHGQNLTGASLGGTLTGTNLTGANLRNAAIFTGFLELEFAIFDSATVYNQWTQFPPGFDPFASGLTLVMSPAGDLDADDALGATDVDLLAKRIGGLYRATGRLPDAAYNVSEDAHHRP